MLAIFLVVLLTMAVSHWLMEPLLVYGTPFLNLTWLGWSLLVALLWLFAGGRPRL